MSVTAQHVSLGYEQLTLSDGDAHALASIPAGACMVVFSVEGGGVRWRADGTAPTSSVGMPLLENGEFTFTCDPSLLQFIRTAGVTTKVNVLYFI